MLNYPCKYDKRGTQVKSITCENSAFLLPAPQKTTGRTQLKDEKVKSKEALQW